jgi:hypothetical protein
MSGCSSRAGAIAGVASRRPVPSASARNILKDSISLTLHHCDACWTAGDAV